MVTYKNYVLDNFLLDCLKKVSSPDVKIVRVGTLAEDADRRLKQCSLREVCSLLTNHKIYTKCILHVQNVLQTYLTTHTVVCSATTG